MSRGGSKWKKVLDDFANGWVLKDKSSGDCRRAVQVILRKKTEEAVQLTTNKDTDKQRPYSIGPTQHISPS